MTTPITLRPARPSLMGLLTALLLSMPGLHCHARQLPGASTNITTSGASVEISRGPHSRVMQSSKIVTSAAGRTVTNKTSYTELATGMSVLRNGVYLAASDQIQITPNGAAMTNCQYRVFFNADLDSPGAIDLITPEGSHMTSDIAALAYFDGVTNVVIATPQNSVGQVLPTLNQVLYTNAFSNALCDVLYDCTLAGLSQTIVIRHQLPSPASLGLTASNIWLQVWTEFSAAPVPQVSQSQINGDQFLLDFGQMKMGTGKAFMLGNHAATVPVYKQWFNSEGKTYLIESVLLSAIEPQLEQLPGGSSGEGGQSRLRLRRPSMLAKAAPRQPAKPVNLPAKKLARNNASQMHMAAKSPPMKGLAMDFELSGSITNYLFAADQTTLIADATYLYGSCVAEGGSVIKFSTNPASSLILQHGTNLQFKSSAFRPVVFTASDDDTVGAVVEGSSGSPNGYYGGTAIEIPYYEESAVTNAWSHLRFSFMNQAMQLEYTTPATISDAQFVNCSQGIYVDTATAKLRNALFYNVSTNFYCVPEPATLDLQNVTVHCDSDSRLVNIAGYESYPWDDGVGADFKLHATNCLFVGTTNLGAGLQISGDSHVTSGSCFITNHDTGIFVTVGAGANYLAPDTYQGLGTTNVDPALLADLQQKTTSPPIVFNGGTGAYYTNGSTTFYPHAQRENSAAPDLGYGYDPIDFTFGGIYLTNVTFTIQPGTVLAALVTNGGNYGLEVANGSQLLCQGTPTNLCRIANFNTVQEQYTTNWATPGTDGSGGMILPNYQETAPNSVINCRFTDFSILAQDTSHIYSEAFGSNNPVNLQDCQFHGGLITSGYTTFNFTNCLLERVYLDVEPQDGAIPLVRNSLMYGGYFRYIPAVTNAIFQDNVFWQSDVDTDLTGFGYNGGFNAYLTNCNQILPTNLADLVLTNIAFQTGPLGFYYYPSGGPLINAGSACATNFGLYHYTTTTNQVPETNSPVDVGYHYVALGTNGLPLSTSGDGIGDYVKDSNGDGVYNTGDLGNWQTNNTAGDGVNDYIKYIEGRNLNVSNYVNDTAGALGLQVYTPLR